MQVNRVNNSTSFTSVIPVKVFYDGLEATSRTNIMRGCQKVIDTMCGPINKTPQFDTAMKYLHHFDKDYSYYRAVEGFDKIGTVTCTVSDNKGYIFTGKEANALKNYGKEIGNQKRICNELGISESFEHKGAKLSYKDLVKRLISQKSRRIQNVYQEGENVISRPVTMEIHMTEPKKKKFALDKIYFRQV